MFTDLQFTNTQKWTPTNKINRNILIITDVLIENKNKNKELVVIDETTFA